METYDDAWVKGQIGYCMDEWRSCANQPDGDSQQYSASEQESNERVYDEALHAVERDLQWASEAKVERGELRERIVQSFAKFSSRALNLEDDAIELLTKEFVPVGTQLAQFARQQYPELSMGDIIQAARNAWTACGLQPLLGAKIALTPSILGYSLLYPHSDNYLDDVDISVPMKLRFSERFGCRLAGGGLAAADELERAIWELIGLIERQYPRTRFPQVFDSLLAIHQAQERSIGQLHSEFLNGENDYLRLSLAKGGTSVLADACLAKGFLNEAESGFAFAWGVLLQLGDDLQDLQDDVRRGSTTLFAQAAVAGERLDGLATQLFHFSERVGRRLEELPNGTASFKRLLIMSWRSLITRAIADSHEFFSSGFVEEAERGSPFRFEFLRARSQRLASRQGLYGTLFSVLLEEPVTPGVQP